MRDLPALRLSSERLIGALVAHDADPGRPALRRPGPVALTGVLIAALGAGLLGGYGMLTGASLAEPTDPSVVLFDRGSGAQYVYLESDRRLHPVLNYTSGLLLAAGESPGARPVATGKLAKVPLGATLGIPDAPDALPPRESLLTGAWTVCTDRAGRSTLLVGTVPPGAPAGARSLLVRDPAGRTFLVRDGRRFQGSADLWPGRTPAPVSTAWIDAVPAGPDLTAAPAEEEQTDFSVRACVTRPAGEPATIRLDPVIPAGTAEIYVPRGTGAVVTSGTGSVQLITEDGRGFPLASQELLARLGYPDVRPVTVPAELLGMLPAGPLLDRELAGRH
ncbi:type VII secretion protein EccB [Actinoplanes sp. L3-i22]|uniref:type VII secretion protein EccB n=1 Tax=Actinoplanes sp. L3-i22 TaxID=2836373 RepID=UPI001C77AEF0|nr:type VII secretion protein EccB [Actinoplanes sp. L3-i22]BCY15533.1 hypothetical protein L3i22_106210 [Actinoplanes sp. L3-i22]